MREKRISLPQTQGEGVPHRTAETRLTQPEIQSPPLLPPQGRGNPDGADRR